MNQKKILIFSYKIILIKSYFVFSNYKKDEINPYILTSKHIIDGLLNATAFYMGLYPDKHLTYWARDASLLAECLSLIQKDARYPNHPNKIQEIYVTKYTSGNPNLNKYLESEEVASDGTGHLMVDTGYHGSLTDLFPKALFHYVISECRTRHIPSTYQLLERLNPKAPFVSKIEVRRFVQEIEQTLPHKCYPVSLQDHPPYVIPQEVSSNPDQVNPWLFFRYVEKIRKRMNKEKVRENFQWRYELWRNFRQLIKDKNKNEIQNMIWQYWDPKNPVSFAIVRDMVDVLPLFNQENCLSDCYEFFSRKISEVLMDPEELRIEEIRKWFKISDLHSLSEQVLAEQIIEKVNQSKKFDPIHLFYLYMSIGNRSYTQDLHVDGHEIMLKLYRAFGRALGSFVASGEKKYDQLYNLIFLEDAFRNGFRTIKDGFIPYLKETENIYLMRLIFDDIRKNKRKMSQNSDFYREIPEFRNWLTSTLVQEQKRK